MAGGRCLHGDGCGGNRVLAHRMRRPGIRVNSEGILYVPDSEEEDSDMETEEDGGAATIAAVEGAPHVVAEGAPGSKETTGGAGGPNVCIQGPLVLANNETAGNEMPTEDYSKLSSRVDADPDVPEALKEVLAHMDPIYHGVFLSMYKILVPICFRPIHS